MITTKKIENKWISHVKNTEYSDVNLICFPYAGGNASFFAPWGRCLLDNVGIVPILYPMREIRMGEKMPDTVEELTDELADQYDIFEKKFIMFSHCTGSLVAYETARKLYERYGISPEIFVTASEPSPRNTIVNKSVFEMNDEQFIDYSISLKLLDKEMISNELFMNYYYPSFRSDFLMHQRYDPDKPDFILDCPIIALRGKDDVLSTQEIIKDWSHYSKDDFYYEEFSGEHFFINEHKHSILDLIFDIYNKIKDMEK